MTAMTHVIAAERLTKTYRETIALDGLTLSIPKDTIVGLIGRNGAGKTTLLKTIAGFIRHSSGNLKVFGEKPFDNLNSLSKTLYMDDARYNDSARLGDIFELTRLYYKGFDVVTASKLMDYFSLSKKAKIKKLSKGTKTLFSLVMAICSRAPLTLFDEPTLGLDASHRKEFISLLLKDYSDYPRTVILSSHLIAELENVMEQIVLIDKGKLVFHKSIDEVQRYAVVLTGQKALLESALANHRVLNREYMGEHMSVGVINDFKEAELLEFKNKGISIHAMNVQDVCIGLTTTDGGVLDAIR